MKEARRQRAKDMERAEEPFEGPMLATLERSFSIAENDSMPLCFDLDGTLGSFDGGYLLLREALGELWGTAPTMEELMTCRGSTDWEIVDELHQRRFQRELSLEGYETYDRICLARFQATFHPTGREPRVHGGLVTGLSQLLDLGHAVGLVSGNTPRILAFKAEALGVDPRVTLLGSLPRCSRTDLLRRAVASGPGPHLYVGDRPHDREAARQAGIPFLGVGTAVPGEHPVLTEAAEALELLGSVRLLLQGLEEGLPE